MNKKGFTLVELLAVLGLLSIIALMATPILLNQIDSQKKKNYENFVGDLCLSAEAYLNHTTNIDGIEDFKSPGDTIDIKLGDLMKNGYVKSNTKNPKTKRKIKAKDTITVTITSNKTYSCELDTESDTPGDDYICKKATTLSSDGTHTFGTLVSGSTLKPGDALDCNVDGTGYNKRFYYVTNLEGKSNYAVLIYNNNTKVVNGTLSNDNTVTFAYHESTNENWHGPSTAITDNLPTTSHWNNISLSSTTRAIKAANYSSGHVYADTTGNGSKALPVDFSYSGKAARLLTYKEVVTACDPNNTINIPTSNGYLDNCAYLMENTHYSDSSYVFGYWLETPVSSNTLNSWGVFGRSSFQKLNDPNTNYNSTMGVRPAIEVKKSDIKLN